ncbi:MAG TPA: YbdD/YjiX family protein [Candidatus Acidoferrales bacterium]
MSKVRSISTNLLRGGWVWLRQVSGDAAYDNYLRSTARQADSGPPLSRAEFYLDLLRRRYSSVSRCC